MEATADDGTLISFDVHGSGPDLVLVHGITESRESWEPLIAPLAEGHRVVALDLRGHGRSGEADRYDLEVMVGDVVAVVAEAGSTDPLLIGHSLGGAVVSAYAAAGGATCGVVNVDQPLLLGGFQAGLRELEPMLRGDDASFRAALAGIFESMIGALGDGERRRIDTIRVAKQDVVLGVWDLVLNRDAGELDEMVTGIAAGISAPYLALHGIDPGPEYEAWVRENITGAEFDVWAETGHYPHLVHPDRFVERVQEFESTL